MSHPANLNHRIASSRPSRWRSGLLLPVLAALLAWEMRASAIVPWTIKINTNNIVVVTNSPYNAIGDGVFTNTTAIQNAINAATTGGTSNGLIGGTVEIPAAGIFLCGPLTLKNNVNLQIDAGAILRMLPYDRYPGGITSPANFISGSSVTNIEVSGFGAIDGQGAPWWPGYKTNTRPIMIRFSSCKFQLIQNVTLSNSPEFHISISGSKGNATVQGVTVRAPSSSDPLTPGHNTDACDVSGTNILVQNCNISVGDDDFTWRWRQPPRRSGHEQHLYGNGHGVSIVQLYPGGFQRHGHQLHVQRHGTTASASSRTMTGVASCKIFLITTSA